MSISSQTTASSTRTILKGKIITVELLEKIRDEAKYSNLEALTKAIASDAAHARNYFQKKAYV